MDDTELVLKLGELTGAVRESNKSVNDKITALDKNFSEKLACMNTEIQGIKETVIRQKEHCLSRTAHYDGMIKEEKINRNWVKKIAFGIGGLISFTVSILINWLMK